MAPALPTGAVGRMLALALLCVAAVLVWLLIVAPLVEWHAQRGEAVERKQALLMRMEALAESLPAWRRAREEAAARGPASPPLLQGNSDALAAAALQGLVQDMATRSGVALRSTEILPAEPRGPYRRIAVRIVAEGQWQVLVALLGAIADAAPRMLVDGLHLRGPDTRAHTDAPPIAANFTVLAFRAADAAAAERP